MLTLGNYASPNLRLFGPNQKKSINPLNLLPEFNTHSDSNSLTIQLYKSKLNKANPNAESVSIPTFIGFSSIDQAGPL